MLRCLIWIKVFARQVFADLPREEAAAQPRPFQNIDRAGDRERFGIGIVEAGNRRRFVARQDGGAQCRKIGPERFPAPSHIPIRDHFARLRRIQRRLDGQHRIGMGAKEPTIAVLRAQIEAREQPVEPLMLGAGPFAQGQMSVVQPNTLSKIVSTCLKW